MSGSSTGSGHGAGRTTSVSRITWTRAPCHPDDRTHRGPLLLVSVTGTLFGLFDQISPVAAVLGLPIFVWELSLGIWMAVKGFRP